MDIKTKTTDYSETVPPVVINEDEILRMKSEYLIKEFEVDGLNYQKPKYSIWYKIKRFFIQLRFKILSKRIKAQKEIINEE